MICSTCGGFVQWRGPSFADMTHTVCEGCGGINCQVVETEDCETCDGEGEVETGSFEAAQARQKCPDCNGKGEVPA